MATVFEASYDELKRLEADVDSRGKTIMLLENELEVLDRSHKDLAHRLADSGREIERLRAALRRVVDYCDEGHYLHTLATEALTSDEQLTS